MEAPWWVTLFVALVTGGGASWGTLLVRTYQQRGREPALVQQITAEAHNAIYGAYGELIAELRKDAALAREEARTARQDAQEARVRAADAEARAAGAEARAVAAESQMTEMAALVRRNIPNADELMRSFEQLIARDAQARG